MRRGSDFVLLDAFVDAPHDALLSGSVPPALIGALNEVERALAELREGAAVTDVNDALVSTRDAADAIATAAQDLPQLSERLDGRVRQA